MSTIAILIDSNEPPFVKKKFKKLGVIVQIKNLPYADIWSARTCVERKTIADLWASIKDKRVFSQAERMAQSGKKNYIVAYGDPNYESYSGYNFMKPLLSSVAKISAWYGVETMFFPDEDVAFQEMYYLFKWNDNTMPIEPVIIRPKPKKINRKILVLMGIQGVGIETAKLLLREYKSIKDLACASMADLCAIKGVGIVTAKKIQEALN